MKLIVLVERDGSAFFIASFFKRKMAGVSIEMKSDLNFIRHGWGFRRFKTAILTRN